MSPSINSDSLNTIHDRLNDVSAAYEARYPGESIGRQPVHTVYGGAHLFRHDSASKLGALALRAVESYAPEAKHLVDAIGVDPGIAEAVYARMLEKLRREPVEDFRIDFEDGYGVRADGEEDACAESAAREVARGIDAGTLPPFLGIRIKPLNGEAGRRGLRTLDVFLTTLAEASQGRLPEHFVITLPKVTSPDQVSVLIDAMVAIEAATSLPEGSLRMELMVETPQSIITHDGAFALPGFVAAARGRCVAAHFGVYDYTASCLIVAEYQRMSHSCCDFARHVMQVSLAGTGIAISDGATNVLPVGPHAGTPDQLTEQQLAENQEAVHRAWRLHADDVRRSLWHGFYQGWDLHPAQLPTRYVALFEFFLLGLDQASRRLSNFIEQAARATLAGDIFDDAATGQGLLNYFLRGVGCGAITPDEFSATGLTMEELHSRSFAKILAGRAGGQR